ncbi:MAG: efflux transporter outer membrane subunit, partial [Acidobacteria bacterium]|nr:efflux transporter outer membrane subunit [Acidobacteriota bacterium]
MIRTTLLSASLVALSACTTLGPKTDPVSHGITLPAAYDHAGTTAEERQDEQAWWADFGSEALDGLVAEALSTNQTLAGGIANVDAARAALKVSNASLLPQASGSVSASSDTEAGLGDVSSSARLSASYQLDLFGANAAALEASRASLEATEFAQRTLELTVQSDVASTYFSLLAAREQLRVAEQNLEISERIFKIVEVKYAAGAISGYDVSSQRAQLANSRARIPELESQITGLETSLAILLGRTPQGYEAPDEKILDIALPAAGSGLPSDLLLRRPDVAAAEARLAATAARIGVARAALFPSIRLTGYYGGESSDLSNLFASGASIWQLAAGL